MKVRAGWVGAGVLGLMILAAALNSGAANWVRWKMMSLPTQPGVRLEWVSRDQVALRYRKAISAIFAGSAFYGAFVGNAEGQWAVVSAFNSDTAAIVEALAVCDAKAEGDSPCRTIAILVPEIPATGVSETATLGQEARHALEELRAKTGNRAMAVSPQSAWGTADGLATLQQTEAFAEAICQSRRRTSFYQNNTEADGCRVIWSGE